MVNLAHAKHYSQTFLVQLAVFLFSGVHGPGSACDWALATVRHDVRRGCPNAVIRYITRQNQWLIRVDCGGCYLLFGLT